MPADIDTFSPRNLVKTIKTIGKGLDKAGLNPLNTKQRPKPSINGTDTKPSLLDGISSKAASLQNALDTINTTLEQLPIPNSIRPNKETIDKANTYISDAWQAMRKSKPQQTLKSEIKQALASLDDSVTKMKKGEATSGIKGEVKQMKANLQNVGSASRKRSIVRNVGKMSIREMVKKENLSTCTSPFNFIEKTLHLMNEIIFKALTPPPEYSDMPQPGHAVDSAPAYSASVHTDEHGKPTETTIELAPPPSYQDAVKKPALPPRNQNSTIQSELAQKAAAMAERRPQTLEGYEALIPKRPEIPQDPLANEIAAKAVALRKSREDRGITFDKQGNMQQTSAPARPAEMTAQSKLPEASPEIKDSPTIQNPPSPKKAEATDDSIANMMALPGYHGTMPKPNTNIFEGTDDTGISNLFKQEEAKPQASIETPPQQMTESKQTKSEAPRKSFAEELAEKAAAKKTRTPEEYEALIPKRPELPEIEPQTSTETPSQITMPQQTKAEAPRKSFAEELAEKAGAKKTRTAEEYEALIPKRPEIPQEDVAPAESKTSSTMEIPPHEISPLSEKLVIALSAKEAKEMIEEDELDVSKKTLETLTKLTKPSPNVSEQDIKEAIQDIRKEKPDPFIDSEERLEEATKRLEDMLLKKASTQQPPLPEKSSLENVAPQTLEQKPSIPAPTVSTSTIASKEAGFSKDDTIGLAMASRRAKLIIQEEDIDVSDETINTLKKLSNSSEPVSRKEIQEAIKDIETQNPSSSDTFEERLSDATKSLKKILNNS